MAESEEKLNSHLMKVKEESEKVGLKLNIQKTKNMASSPITSWEIDGETVETVRDLTLVGSNITADGNCSHEIKRHLLLGRKAMTNLDCILKRHYFANKGPYSQSYDFSSPAFLMMYSAYKLNKQGDNIHSFSYLEPVCCSMSSSNCCFMTCIQISQEAGQVIGYT